MTGGDTDHYTNEDTRALERSSAVHKVSEMGPRSEVFRAVWPYATAVVAGTALVGRISVADAVMKSLQHLVFPGGLPSKY